MFKINITSILVTLLLCSSAFLSTSEAAEAIYIHPVVYKTEDVSETERGYVAEVYKEEMLAYQWLKVYDQQEISQLTGSAKATSIKACKSAKCVLPHLRSGGVKRMVYVKVSKQKRRTYVIDAAVLSNTGKTLFSYSFTERGSPTEMKYIMPTVIENLFKQEFSRHGNSVAISLDDEDAVTSTQADERIQKGDEMLEEGNTKEALALYAEAAKMSPELATPWRRMAEAKLESGDTKGALQSIDKAIKIAPKDASSYETKGEILLQIDKKRQAVKAFVKATALDGKLTRSYFMLGQILDELGRTSDAIKAFEALKVVQQDDAVIYINLGKLYLKAKKYANARDALLRAKNISPSEASLYPALAEAYEKLKDWYEAAACYAELIELMPDCPACHFNHGRMLEKCGMSHEAITAYDTSIEQDEAFADAYYSAAFAYIGMGEKDSARPYLVKYIEVEKRPDQAAFVKKAKQLLMQ